MSGQEFRDYIERLILAAGEVQEDSIRQTINLLRNLSNGTVYVIGNGGSAAIASHFATDLFRVFEVIKSTNKVLSLVDNTPLLLASGNDFGFESIFERQLAKLGREKDVLIAISSSGNSQNILNAIHAAKEMGMTTIGLSGFDGGKLLNRVDISIYVKTNVGEYQIVEDVHSSICHFISKSVGDLV